MLTVPVLPCPTHFIVPRLTLPVVIAVTDHHTDGCQPSEGSRRALVDNPYTHSHMNTYTQTQLQAHTLPLSYIQWQTPTHAELRASENVLVNDKLQPTTTDPCAALLRDSWDLSQGDPVPSRLPLCLSSLPFPLLTCTSSWIHTDHSTDFKVQLQ